MGPAGNTPMLIFVSPELCSERDYVITHFVVPGMYVVRSMYM